MAPLAFLYEALPHADHRVNAVAEGLVEVNDRAAVVRANLRADFRAPCLGKPAAARPAAATMRPRQSNIADYARVAQTVEQRTRNA